MSSSSSSSTSFVGCGPFQLSALDMIFTVKAIRNNQQQQAESSKTKTIKEQRSSRVLKIRLVCLFIIALLLLWIFLPIDLSADSSSSSTKLSVSSFFKQSSNDQEQILLLDYLQRPQIKSRFPAIVKFAISSSSSKTTTKSYLFSNCASSIPSSLQENVTSFMFSGSSSSSSAAILSSPLSNSEINQTYWNEISSSCSDLSNSWLNGTLESCSNDCKSIAPSTPLMFSSSAQFLVLFNRTTTSSNNIYNITFVASRNKIYGLNANDDSQLNLGYFARSDINDDDGTSSSTFTVFGHDVKQVVAGGSNDELISATIERHLSSSSSNVNELSKAFIVTRHVNNQLLNENNQVSFVSVTELSENDVEIVIPSPTTKESNHEDIARACIKTLSLVSSVILLIYLIFVALEDDTVNNGWSSATKSIESKKQQHGTTKKTTSSSSSSISLFLLSVPLLVTQLIFISDPSWFFVISSDSSSMNQINPTVTGIFGNNAVRWFDLIFRTWVVPVLALLPFWSNAEEVNSSSSSSTSSSSSSPSISELEEDYGKIAGKIEIYMIVEIFKTHFLDAFKGRGSFWFIPLCVSFFTFALHIVESLSVAEVNRATTDQTSMLFSSSSCSSSSSFGNSFATSNTEQSDDNDFYYSLIPRTSLTSSSSLDSNNGFAVFTLTNFLFQFLVVLFALVFILFGWNNKNKNKSKADDEKEEVMSMTIYNIRSFTTRRFLSIKWGVQSFLVPILIGELFLMFWTELFVPMNLFEIGDRIFLSSANVAGLASGGQIMYSLFKVSIVILILHPLPQFLLTKLLAVDDDDYNQDQDEAEEKEEERKEGKQTITASSHHQQNLLISHKHFWRQPLSGFLHQKKIVIGTSIGDIHEAKHPEENVHPLSQAIASATVMVCDDEEMFDVTSVHGNIDQNNKNKNSKNQLSPQQIAALPRPAHVLDYSHVYQNHLVISDGSSLVVEEAVANAFSIGQEALRNTMTMMVINDKNTNGLLSQPVKSFAERKRAITGNVPFRVCTVDLMMSTSLSETNINDVRNAMIKIDDDDETKEPAQTQNPLASQHVEEKEDKKTSPTHKNKNKSGDDVMLLSCFSLPEIIQLPNPFNNKMSDPSNEQGEVEDERKYQENLEKEARENATQFLFVLHDDIDARQEEESSPSVVLNKLLKHCDWSDREIGVKNNHSKNNKNINSEKDGNCNQQQEQQEHHESSPMKIDVKPSATEEEEEDDNVNDNENENKNVQIATREEEQEQEQDDDEEEEKEEEDKDPFSRLTKSLRSFCKAKTGETPAKREIKIWFVDFRSTNGGQKMTISSIVRDFLSSFWKNNTLSSTPLLTVSSCVVIDDRNINGVNDLLKFEENVTDEENSSSSCSDEMTTIYYMKLISDLNSVLIDETETVKPTSRIINISSSASMETRHVLSIQEVPILVLMNRISEGDRDMKTKATDLFAVPSDFVLELMRRGM